MHLNLVGAIKSGLRADGIPELGRRARRLSTNYSGDQWEDTEPREAEHLSGPDSHVHSQRFQAAPSGVRWSSGKDQRSLGSPSWLLRSVHVLSVQGRRGAWNQARPFRCKKFTRKPRNDLAKKKSIWNPSLPLYGGCCNLGEKSNDFVQSIAVCGALIYWQWCGRRKVSCLGPGDHSCATVS